MTEWPPSGERCHEHAESHERHTAEDIGRPRRERAIRGRGAHSPGDGARAARRGDGSCGCTPYEAAIHWLIVACAPGRVAR